jgi:methylmalonyl-CoA mutase N-terminal domain/subunit
VSKPSASSEKDALRPPQVARQRVYGPADLPPYEQIGEPGRYPFTRGLHPEGYAGRLWTMRQYAGFGTAVESNRRYRYLLEQGVTGLSVAFDLPTQIGYDSDDPHAVGEVGRVGVAIDSLEDMETLLEGIPLDRVSTSMTINATAAILLALYVAVARRRGVGEDALSGTVQNDILKEYVARGTWIYPPPPSLRLVTDLFRYCFERVPRWNPISISGYHMREAGATAAQELAFTLAHALEYARAARQAGLDLERFGERVSFFFACHTDFIEEVAKFRAARRLWARLVKERLGVSGTRAQQMRFHVQTGGVTLTAQQPDNNVVRVALQALAAVLGGAQSLHTNARDEALALPTEDSARLALRTQQLIAYESGVAELVDPLGGAWAVEAATSRVEREAEALLDRVEEKGGALAAIERGDIQREIQESAYRSSARWRAGSACWWGSTASWRAKRARPWRRCAWIPSSSRRRSSACARCAAAATLSPGSGRCRRWRPAPAARRTCCRPSWTRSWPGPRWVRWRRACAASSGSTGRPWCCEGKIRRHPDTGAQRGLG